MDKDIWPTAKRRKPQAFRVGVMPAVGTPTADILFLPGFADRLDNHEPLFTAWASAGYRVISFDYPGHGETCGPDSDINHFTMKNLGEMASYVETITSESPSRPLFIAGWSTGGLLAVRTVQDSTFARFSRSVAGLILFAPGVAVHTLVGDWGKVTTATLTRNQTPPHLGPIKPLSPLLSPAFALDLVLNATASFADTIPPQYPVIVYTGGDQEDHYAVTSKLKTWVGKLKDRNGAPVTAVACAGGYHELDNEPDPMGDQVRQSSTKFVKAVRGGDAGYVPMTSGPCARF